MAAGVSRTPVTDHGTDVWPGDSPRERDPVRGTHVRRDMSHPIVLRTRGFAVTVAVLAGVSAKVYVMLYIYDQYIERVVFASVARILYWPPPARLQRND